ncbi:MAG TPA: NAD(P)/FAD-dependent oxidoreductase [bacterium]|nr:NAD(P)/FAD-dependent oxidoreductase [bacterium]
MNYDVAIIGGGPAGLMAASRAGELGFSVVLLEKNDRLGLKLLSTGGGRSNITNLNDIKNIAKSFGDNGKWLISGLSKFGPEDVLNFFYNNNLETKIEDNGRVFPKSNSSQKVLEVFSGLLKKYSVYVKTSSEVKNIILKNNEIEKIILKNKEEIVAKKYIICTGGKSYPITGSTGDGYGWLKKMGHDIIKLRPALVPIIIKNSFIKELEGLSLSDAVIFYPCKDKKNCSERGDLIFTGNGLSGPAILNISGNLGNIKNQSEMKIKIDLFPDLDFLELDKKIQNKLGGENKLFKNALLGLVPPKLIPILIVLLKINAEKKANLISRIERQNLARLLKGLELDFLGPDDFERAMITAGGVNLKEVDPRNMKSKIINNLYIAGEILDLNGPTGGYNLQVCWTTGYIAGELL